MAQTITTRVSLTGGSVALVEGGTYTCPPLADGKGGAVSNDGGTVTGANVTFFGNAVPSGGAVYNKSGSITFPGESVSFADNTATSMGGAIYSNGGSISFTCDSVSFTGNTAKSSSGAIYNQGSTITIAGNAKFTGNRCYNGNCGALCNTYNGTVSFTGDSVSFTSNSAKNHGGAIYGGKGSILFAGANVTFSDNTAGSNGGAIYTSGGSISFTGASVSFSGNSAASGGAIYNGGTSTINFAGAIDLATASDTWVNGGSTSENYATVNWDLTNGLTQYGTIKNFERYSNINDYVKQTITVTADQAAGGYTIATGSLGSLAENVKTFTVKTAEDATGVSLSVGGSSVKYGGDMIYYSLANVNDAQLVLTVTDTSKRTLVKKGTTATLVTGATYTCPFSQLGGAAVDVSGGTVFGTDITFAGNTATCGGAIRLVSGAGALVFDGDVIFVGNTATAQKGGAIYANVEGSKLLFAGGTFAGNAASQLMSGGAITCFHNNTTTGYTIRFSDDVIFDNNLVARKNSGGAIFINPLSQLTFEKNVTFTGNTGSSGALYSNGKNGGRNTLVFGGDLIASNNASISFSNEPAQGAIYAYYSDGTVSGDAIFTGNTCSGGKGSALSLSYSTFSFAGGTFANNVMVASGTTACYGSAIYASKSSALTFTDDVVFAGNTMASSNAFGGAIYNGGTVTLQSATFTGNTATGDGGAIYNDNGGTVTLKGAVTLATASDDIYNKGTLNWDLSGDTTGKLENYQYLNNDGGTLTITVAATQPIGNYVIATGNFTDFANKDTFIVKTAEDATGAAVKIKGAGAGYGNLIYSLTIDDNDTPMDPSDDKLILNAKDAGTVLEITKAAGYGPVDDFLVYSREACSLGGVDRGSVFASAFFGGTVSAGSGLLASPTLAM